MQSVETSFRPKGRRGVLLTSPGGKAGLVDAFRNAALPRGVKVFGCDLDSSATTRDRFDRFYTTPGSDTPAYRDAVLAICEADPVGLVVPTRDGDMPALAALAEQLSEIGARVLLPDADTVEECQDKLRFSKRLEEHGYRAIPVLKNVDGGALPMFTRPRVGSASRGAGPVRSVSEAKEILVDERKLLHPLLDLPEYSIDVLSDLDGAPIQAVARRRRQVVDGESVLTTVESHSRLEEEAMGIARLFGLRGHSTLQAFLGRDDVPIFVEANLRFGGASSLSIEAGLRSPERILDMAFGADAEADRAKSDWPIDRNLSLQRTETGDRYFHQGRGGPAQGE